MATSKGKSTLYVSAKPKPVLYVKQKPAGTRVPGRYVKGASTKKA